MAESLQKYDIHLTIASTLKKMRTLKQQSKKFNKANEDSLSRQIRLQSRLNALKGAGVQLGHKAAKASGIGAQQLSGTSKPRS